MVTWISLVCCVPSGFAAMVLGGTQSGLELQPVWMQELGKVLLKIKR